MSFLSRHPLLVTGFLLAVILLSWFCWQLAAIRQESEFHEYQYRVFLSTESSLENVTLILPVPFLGNTSSLGEALVKGDGYGIPPSWRLSLERVNDTPMLGIRADEIVPEYHGYPLPLEWGETPTVTPHPAATAYSEETPVLIPLDFGNSRRVEGSIETRSPLNREPLLVRPELVQPVPCRDPPMGGSCYRFRVPLYVQYAPRNAGRITLSVSGGGINEWWVGGWSGNSYGDTVELTLENNQQGWIEAEGLLSTGMGRY
jgi:hypothetical protein